MNEDLKRYADFTMAQNYEVDEDEANWAPNVDVRGGICGFPLLGGYCPDHVPQTETMEGGAA